MDGRPINPDGDVGNPQGYVRNPGAQQRGSDYRDPDVHLGGAVAGVGAHDTVGPGRVLSERKAASLRTKVVMGLAAVLLLAIGIGIGFALGWRSDATDATGVSDSSSAGSAGGTGMPIELAANKCGVTADVVDHGTSISFDTKARRTSPATVWATSSVSCRYWIHLTGSTRISDRDVLSMAHKRRHGTSTKDSGTTTRIQD